MINKKITSVVLIFFLMAAAALLSACGTTGSAKTETTSQEDLTSKISSKIDAYTTDLMDSRDSMKSNRAICRYLQSWAKSKGIHSETDSAGNVIMSVSSSKKYKDAAPVVIVCPYDYLEFDNYSRPVAMALYTIKNNESTGKLTVIFTREDGHDLSGVKTLNKKYFTDDANVFCLNAADQGLFSLKSGASSTYRFTQSVRRVSPTLTKAYKITIKGLSVTQPDAQISKATNPITRLESLLVSLKNRNISYEIASFRGGENTNLYAASATLTIVIDANKEKSFLDKMQEVTERFNEDKSKMHPGATYTYKEVDLPSSVIRRSDGSRLVNFMYTLLDGVYEKDEDSGDLVSINNVSKIDTSGSRVQISSVAYSLSETNLKTIDTDARTLCNLSDIKFSKTGSVPMWTGKEDTEFTKNVASAYKKTTGKTLSYNNSVTSTSASYVAQKNSNCNIISITLNENILKDCTGTMINYLINSLPEDDD